MGFATYENPTEAWADRLAIPTWSRWLTLSDFIGGGLPDNDPNSQFQAVSEPSPGVIRITSRTNGVSTDGYQEGTRWNLGVNAPWIPASVGYKADGTQSFTLFVKEAVAPVAHNGLGVGIGVFRPAAPVAGLAMGLSYETVAPSRRVCSVVAVARTLGAASATLNIAQGSIILGQGAGDNGFGLSVQPGGFTSSGLAVGFTNGISAAQFWTSAPASVGLFLFTYYLNAAPLISTVDFQARWCLHKCKPPVL